MVDEAGADGGCDMGLAGAARPEDEDIGARLDPGIASGQRSDMGFADRGGGGEVEGLERLAWRQGGFGEVSGDAAGGPPS
jgi:hypothetical protein